MTENTYLRNCRSLLELEAKIAELQAQAQPIRARLLDDSREGTTDVAGLGTITHVAATPPGRSFDAAKAKALLTKAGIAIPTKPNNGRKASLRVSLNV